MISRTITFLLGFLFSLFLQQGYRLSCRLLVDERIDGSFRDAQTLDIHSLAVLLMAHFVNVLTHVDNDGEFVNGNELTKKE